MAGISSQPVKSGFSASFSSAWGVRVGVGGGVVFFGGVTDGCGEGLVIASGLFSVWPEFICCAWWLLMKFLMISAEQIIMTRHKKMTSAFFMVEVTSL